MALRNFSILFSRRLLRSNLGIKNCRYTLSVKCTRFLTYNSVPYNDKPDPRSLFFSMEVQTLLRCLTRVDLSRVFRKKKLGEKLEDPVYKFMTDAELETSMKEAHQKADELLQMPPAIPTRQPDSRILSRDSALQGLETSKYVFLDITYGLKDIDRLCTVRDVDGTLRIADFETTQRMLLTYFPKPGKTIKPPRVFSNEYLESILDRQEYEFVLDLACLQFEPYDPEYQKIVSITYQHLNDNNAFEKLRSTRHFGSLCFFLVWNKTIDNLLLDLMETLHIDEAHQLLELYAKVHNVVFEKDGNLKDLEDYIKRFSNKKGMLELALQAYKDVSKKKAELEGGIKAAHGLS